MVQHSGLYTPCIRPAIRLQLLSSQFFFPLWRCRRHRRRLCCRTPHGLQLQKYCRKVRPPNRSCIRRRHSKLSHRGCAFSRLIHTAFAFHVRSCWLWMGCRTESSSQCATDLLVLYRREMYYYLPILHYLDGGYFSEQGWHCSGLKQHYAMCSFGRGGCRTSTTGRSHGKRLDVHHDRTRRRRVQHPCCRVAAKVGMDSETGKAE
jgi:hypothetical protein